VSRREHRAIWLRAWHFELLVLAAIVLAGALTHLASTVLYFPIDVEITRAVQRVESPSVLQLFQLVSWIGFPPRSNVIFGGVILGLFVFGWRLEALMTAVAALGSAGLWYLIAGFVGRPRPSPDMVHVAMQLPSGSFPSGHVLNLTAIFGFLMYLTIVHSADTRWRALLAVLLALPIVTIGPARVYEGAHWPSDALGGYLIGGIWLALTIRAYRWARRRRDDTRDAPDAAEAERIRKPPTPVRLA